jgi:uncharacterized protein involved in exopolysaccharide biosynthesis
MKNLEIGQLSGQQDISLRDLWQIILRKKRVIISTVLVVFGLVTLYSFLAKPKYTATGQLLIDREPNILSFEDIFQIEALNDDYFQTQYKLLQSRALAGETIDRMKFHGNESFVKAAVGEGGLRAEDLRANPRLRGELIDALLNSQLHRP